MITFSQKIFSWNSLGDPVIQIQPDLYLKKTEPLKFFQWLGKIIKPLGRHQEKNLYYDIIQGNKEIGGIGTTEESPEEISIIVIELKENLRGQGIGGKVINAILDFIKSKGYKKVTLQAFKEREPFYERLGFKKTGVISKYDGLIHMTKTFSRHTPNDLEQYKLDQMSSKQIKKLSKGEEDAYINADMNRASRNQGKYVRKKLPKYVATGAAVGAGLGALAGPEGSRGATAVVGALGGMAAGLMGATIRGTSKAEEEGHSRKRVMASGALKIDRIKGKDSDAYSRAQKREFDREAEMRRHMDDQQRNAAIRSLR